MNLLKAFYKNWDFLQPMLLHPPCIDYAQPKYNGPLYCHFQRRAYLPISEMDLFFILSRMCPTLELDMIVQTSRLEYVSLHLLLVECLARLSLAKCVAHQFVITFNARASTSLALLAIVNLLLKAATIQSFLKRFHVESISS